MTDASELCGTKLGNYRLERILGRGRMGVVYLARDEALLRPTALKVLSWRVSDREGQDPEAWLLAEARSVARVNHPNVVQIYGVARQDKHCYIAMEYVAGGPVDSLVTKLGPMSPVQATSLLIQCAEALQAAHDAGIVHRDVKPENLLIGADGSAKLGDFGMALHVARPRPNEPARAGTPFYTAPEIWTGQAATPATDLYALGATYFFMLTGHVPFESRDLPSLIAAHLRAPLPSASTWTSQVPEGCDKLIRRCLAKSPKDRYTSARALSIDAQALLASLQKSPRSLHAETNPPKLSSPSRRSEPTSTTAQAAEESESNALRTDQYATLLRWLESENTSTMVVVGEPGCGKTTLLRKIAAQYARHNAVFYFDGSTITTYGAATPSSARDANGVLIGAVTVHLNQPPTVDWRNLVQVEPSSIPLYVIDANAYATQQYTSLLNALSPLVDSRRFKIAVTSLPNDVTRWLELTRERTQVRPGVCELPPLSLPKAYAYVAHRIRSSQPNQPDLLLTPDARLLIAYFGVGNPGRIAEFTAQLVSFARAASIHVLTSWEVWNVQFSAGEDASLAHLLDGSSRPEKWPTAPVLSLLNQCRKTCGLLQRRDTP